MTYIIVLHYFVEKKIHAVHCSRITKYYTNEKTILIAYNICASGKKKNVGGAWEWSVYFFDLFTNNDKNIHHNQSRKKKKNKRNIQIIAVLR